MTDHHWLELAASYALGALGPDERAGFDSHLAECATCRAEVQAFREVGGLLASAAPAVAPPPGLRERILRDARRVRPIGTQRRPVLPWIAAAAALVLALGAGYGYWSARVAQTALRSSLDSTRARLDSASQLVAAILDSTVGTADLAATGKPPSMRLFWNRARNVVVVAAFELPPAHAGRTYQLWAIKKGQAPVSLGTFNTPPSGRAVVTLHMPAGFKPDLSAVTEEPAGGSPQPTQQPFLVGPWQGGG
jgi:anti-sigma-K factor RskA